MCRKHAEHSERHGHPAKPPYSKAEIGPYVSLSRKWLRKVLHGKVSPSKGRDPEKTVRNAILRVSNLLYHSPYDGRATLPTDPKGKARAILGRLRWKYTQEHDASEGVRFPLRLTVPDLAKNIVVYVLALELAAHFDPSPANDETFLKMQLGKAIHRRAGGHKRVYEREYTSSQREFAQKADGTFVQVPKALWREQFEFYGLSKGSAVALVGAWVRQGVEGLWDEHSGDLIALAADTIPRETLRNWTDPRSAPKSKRGGKRKPARPALNSFRGRKKSTKLTCSLP